MEKKYKFKRTLMYEYAKSKTKIPKLFLLKCRKCDYVFYFSFNPVNLDSLKIICPRCSNDNISSFHVMSEEAIK